MTTPGEIPVYTSLRWSRIGCTVCGIEQTATVDGHHGRRCSLHPPRFDVFRAVALMASGWIDAALAYTRVEFP